jgi:hypothetical protein
MLFRIIFRFDADPNPDPHHHFDADPDPAPHLSDANLRLLAFGPSTAPFSASTTLNGYILSLHCAPGRPWLHLELPRTLSFFFTLVRIQIQLFT